MKFLAAGEESRVGINTCLLTYQPQLFRYSGAGLIANDDFCIAESPDYSVSIINTFKPRF